jgi:hypothetical protein
MATKTTAPKPDPHSSGFFAGWKPVHWFILIVAVGLIGYALWPGGVERRADSGVPEAAAEPLLTAQIYPQPAYATNPLEVRLADRYWMLQDSLDCRWYRNDRIIEAATGTKLSTHHFQKGDEIFVEVSLRREGRPPHTFRTAVTKIRNTPPRIMSATTILQQPPNRMIEAVVQGQDVDGDQISYRYTWFKNGKRLPDQADVSVDPAFFARGDQVYAEVVADDGDDSSPKIKSQPMTLENSPPRIASVPPQEMTEGRLFVYQLQAADADGDKLIYQLTQSPPGMTVGPTGRIEWQLPAAEPGTRTFPVTVVVKDEAGGESSQSFEIALAGVKKDEVAKKE